MQFRSFATAPGPVRAAAIIFALYGTAVLVNATIQQHLIGWDAIEARGYPRAVIRFLGMALIAVGLLRRARWAWWLAVVLPSLWLLLGTSGLALLWLVREDASAFPEPGDLAFGLTSVAALSTGVVLLLLPGSRRAFRSGADV